MDASTPEATPTPAAEPAQPAQPAAAHGGHGADAPLWPGQAPSAGPNGSAAPNPGEPVWPSAPPVGPPAGPDPAAAWPTSPPAGQPASQPVATASADEWWASSATPGGADPGNEETVLIPQGLWQKMKADPEYAPEHLALAAVQQLGPAARVWVDRTRAKYPGIPADTVAQIAARRFTTFARLSGAAAGATGLPGVVIDVGVLAWTQARMVLHIAAAYGFDPSGSERATELLVLQKVHAYAETSRTALAVARGREQAGALFGKAAASRPMGQMLVLLGLKLAHMAGVKAAKKMFAKMVPFAGVFLGTWANASATKDLARRTIALYGRPEAHPQARPQALPPPRPN